MKTELKTRPCLKAVFQIIWNTDANFLNLHIDKATKTRGDKQLFNHVLRNKHKPKLFTANVACNGTVIKLPKTEKPILFLNFKLLLNGGDLVFWFTFNLAVAHFRPKMALTLELLSDQMHTLPRNSAVQTLFLLFASFRKSKSALCHLLCEATCLLRTDTQLRNNVTSVDEYSTIVTVQQLGDRITGGYLTKFVPGGSASRSNPLPFHIPFSQKRYPFYIPFIEKRYPFHIPILGSLVLVFM